MEPTDLPTSGAPAGERLRVGVVGARKAVQGIGAFVARAFAAAGCDVVAIAGTSDATVRQAADDLQRKWGLSPQPFVDTGEMLARSRLDVLAICSPAGHHKPALRLGLEAGAHVLCEKPLWWEPGLLAGGAAGRQQLAADVAELARGFAARGRLLALNTQWPFTLEAYRRLFPTAEAGGVRQLRMLLSPARTGAAMIVDAAPHALSLLVALLGPGTVEAPDVRRPLGDDTALDLHFGYRHAAGSAAVELILRHAPRQPRPAGYGLNGHWAERLVALPDYTMSLAGGWSRVDLPDPLDRLVADFAARARRGETADERVLVESLTLLRDLVAATGEPEVSG